MCRVAASVRKALTSENCIDKFSFCTNCEEGMGRTSKRPIQGKEEGSAAADSVVCADGVGGELVDDEGLVESTMTRHSMPSDNSIYQTEPSALRRRGVYAKKQTYITSFFNARISVHSHHFRFHDIYSSH